MKVLRKGFWTPGLASGVALIAFAVTTAMGAAPERLNVQSPDWATGATIPTKFTADGQDLSPNLYWSKAPASCKSIAITCTDPDAPRGTWWHWIIFNLPPETTQLREHQSKSASLAGGACQGVNDFGKVGYNGPDPPGGKTHHYHFAVYALDSKLNVRAGCTKTEIGTAMNGHVVAAGEYIGVYARR